MLLEFGNVHAEARLAGLESCLCHLGSYTSQSAPLCFMSPSVKWGSDSTYLTAVFKKLNTLLNVLKIVPWMLQALEGAGET